MNFASELQEIDNSVLPLREKYIAIRQLLDRACKDLTKEEILQFPSLFSRIVFVARKYNLPQKLEWALQTIRIRTAFLLKDAQNLVSEHQYESAKQALTCLFSVVYDGIIEAEFEYSDKQEEPLSLHKLRVQVTAIDREQQLLIVHAADAPDELYVKYNVPKINDIFNTTVDKLWCGAQLNLADCRIDTETNYIIPQYIVLEPDYLLDASAMAECFQNYGRSHLHYFRKKFEASANSVHILMGNLANFFLDELVYSEHPAALKFEETFLKAFRQTPFEFTSCNDIQAAEDFRHFMSRAKMQFTNIQRVVAHDFPRNGIDTNLCTLEPSFFCETFGFQGRLDMLQLPANEKNGMIQIVELKSGGLPFPKDDPGKIALNHEAQTAIYRLIIQSVFGKTSRQISPMLLYSAAENECENLRMPATYRNFEKEIINVRNLIVAAEHELYTGDNETVAEAFEDVFDIKNYSYPPQFFIDRLVGLNNILKNISELERNYFYRYITFLSRELYIQKTGGEGAYSGNANVWSSEFRERQEAFDLISDLEIEEIDETGRDMKIRFRRNNPENFVNFREGEICILYPRDNETDTALTNQILKGAVANIKNTEIIVRFRYKQKNKRYLHSYRHWVIEHDKLDHACNAMYKGLFAFLTSPAEKRRLLLGMECPASNYRWKGDDNQDFPSEEKREHVLHKAADAQDYFLIVGPPGTGKTSIFARRLIEHFYSDTSCNILVMAYTNRAVDELCEAVSQALGSGEAYIRIGSELSCAEKYRNRLLQNIASEVRSRDELRTLIRQKRIFTGTLASITGKPELFDMKKFNIAIIDEASQILEPQIIGLLPKFDRFIMIGDHKQLSTITLQDENKSKVTDAGLNGIELYDCRESYFERMFRLCRKNGWKHAYDTLTYQGRMHSELSAFPCKYFYDNRLFPAGEWQTTPLEPLEYDASNPYQALAATKRVGFVPANRQGMNHMSDKINEEEACIAVQLAQAVATVYQMNNLPFDADRTLGIITPYRNQIALIRHKLEKTHIPELQTIMVDTVERYQGSQRDVIILSFCMNKPYQLDFFCNLNREKTVDRKLNVALTRARQQLFLTGNEHILRQNPIYNSLLEEVGREGIDDFC
jgi:DNA replication ATP-dependent helicase Dna2